MFRIGVLSLGTVVVAMPLWTLALNAKDSPKKVDEAKSIEGVVVRASSIAGMAVRSPADKDLGKVEDVVIDMETGSVRYAAISFGGLLGAGEKLFAVPFRALHVRQEPKSKSPHFELDVSKETLKKAKGFDKKHWPDFADPRFAEENDRYFVEVQVRKEKP